MKIKKHGSEKLRNKKDKHECKINVLLSSVLGAWRFNEFSNLCVSSHGGASICIGQLSIPASQPGLLVCLTWTNTHKQIHLTSKEPDIVQPLSVARYIVIAYSSQHFNHISHKSLTYSHK